MSEPVAISGMAVLTPLADNVEDLRHALLAGQRRFEASDIAGVSVSRLRDFDASRYCNVRGMRVYPRTSQMEICAAKLALADAGLPDAEIDPLQLGLVTASGFAHMDTLIEYDKGLHTLGMQRTNPTLMPLSIPSAPGAATSLALGAKAFSITINTGGASGLAALGLAARLIADGRAQVCVVAGAFAWCRDLALSGLRAGFLTDSEHSEVFGGQSRGALFGEAAAALVLEPAARVSGRGRTSHGRVLAHAAAFALETSRTDETLARACEDALRRAEVSRESVSLVATGANGVVDGDSAQRKAVERVLGEHRANADVTAIKAALGESLDVSGLLQCVTTLGQLRDGAGLLIDCSTTGACEALVVRRT